ncbi:DUF4145 domain-containing protein [Acinetobacter sp. DSM 11652]|uniref:DUF4145 domain-containing protein n=1 Tax=Acinetobacter sp. DSM 11652 TaxID=346222 RepID=UPI0008B5278C|nr:DUF4145 domain-containing protein [Acinetobacter sp. DSM 11652]SEM09460.1 protein of unknown function [Acinetobacter sp. DSM 11652]
MNIISISIPQSLEGKITQTNNIEICLCIGCKTYLKHEVLVDIYHTHDEYDGILTMYYNHRILRCINCDLISYQDKTVNSEYVDQIGEEDDGTPIWEENELIQVYPLRDNETAFSKEFEKILPEEIYSTYEEVITALNNKMPLLTGLGLRTLLEQIVKYFGKFDDLGIILTQFEEDGYISTKQRALLDDIRYLGNDAAHRADPKSRKDLILHLKVLENLIQQLFVYYKLEEESQKK